MRPLLSVPVCSLGMQGVCGSWPRERGSLCEQCGIPPCLFSSHSLLTSDGPKEDPRSYCMVSFLFFCFFFPPHTSPFPLIFLSFFCVHCDSPLLLHLCSFQCSWLVHTCLRSGKLGYPFSLDDWNFHTLRAATYWKSEQKEKQKEKSLHAEAMVLERSAF